MKKLVTAFAACMIAGLVSAQSVTSLNIVGYTTLDLPVGFRFITSPFIPAGGTNTIYKLSNLSPNANWDGANYDTIQLIDETGSTVLTAMYYAGYGWCDFNDVSTMLDDYQIPAGVCAFLEATQADAQITAIGEVALTALTLPLPQGFSLVGNSVPRQITLGEIVPNANWDGANYDTIQFIDATGTTVLTAMYYAGYGWCDFNDVSTMLDTYALQPGQGFFLEATQADAALDFPAAL